MAGSLKSILCAIIFLLGGTMLHDVNAYHGRQVFYDDPYYYGDRYSMYSYPYYTHHQYHVLSYNDHYGRYNYNRYYYYPPPRYDRYYYPSARCRYPGDLCVN